MLFNSYVFVFVHLPLTLAGFFFLARVSHRLAAFWLLIMSLIFYGWVQPKLVLLLVASALFNFGIGFVIQREKRRSQSFAQVAVALGVCMNLFVLGYYKYADFFISNLNFILRAHLPEMQILLPLGISFFTFTQIAYLVDCFQKDVDEYDIVHYLLFVSFFPHLIAGPIIHHSELMPQFAKKDIYRFDVYKFTLGLSVFIVGLFKKVVLADGVSAFVAPVFDQANQHSVSFGDGWGAALAYSLQIYFDFSAYSDMAIGISAMFGILLPINFWSPYKSRDIIEFWRRWHMTLSRFLRDYVYFPLGGNRLGVTRRHVNLMVTMLLGGLWHGASWTFVAWGGLHGLFLVINHAWRGFVGDRMQKAIGGEILAVICVGITYIAVVFTWVLFRSDAMAASFNMLSAMTGFDLFGQHLRYWSILKHCGSVGHWVLDFVNKSNVVPSQWNPLEWLLIASLLIIVWFMPNTIQLFGRYQVSLPLQLQETNLISERQIRWTFTPAWLVFHSILAAVSIMKLSDVTQFLYYRF
jgi:alginate O-acetyltransferase complex protein AlgI